MEHVPAGQEPPNVLDTVQAIARGEMPSNVELQNSIQNTLEAITVQTRNVDLNERGERLAQDTKNLLQATQKFLSEKNSDEKLQEFITLGKEALAEASSRSENIIEELKDPLVSYNQEHLVYVARRLAFDIIYSREFRGILGEFLEVVQGIFWKGKENAKELAQEAVPAITNYVATGATPAVTPAALANALAQVGPSSTDIAVLQNKLKKILSRIAKNPEYHRSILSLFRLIELLRAKSAAIQHEVYLTPKDQDKLLQLWRDLKDIIERFTGPQSMDPLVNTLEQFFTTVSADSRTADFFKTARKFVQEVLDNPSVLKSEKIPALDKLVVQARELMSEPQYSHYSDTLFDHSRFLLSRFTEDPVTQELSQSFATFVQDLVKDSFTGKPSINAFKSSLVQLKKLLSPLIMSQLQNIAVARIEGVTPSYDFIIDNVNLSAVDVMPEHIHIDFDTSIDINLNQTETDKTVGHLTVKVENIKSHIKNVLFAYRRKSFPRIEDEGTVDIDVTGAGTSIILKWKVKTVGDEPMRFKLADSSCSISGLKINVKEATHSWLDTIVSKMFAGRVQTELESEIDRNLKYVGESLSFTMNQALQSISDKVNSL